MLRGKLKIQYNVLACALNTHIFELYYCSSKRQVKGQNGGYSLVYYHFNSEELEVI